MKCKAALQGYRRAKVFACLLLLLILPISLYACGDESAEYWLYEKDISVTPCDEDAELPLPDGAFTSDGSAYCVTESGEHSIYIKDGEGFSLAARRDFGGDAVSFEKSADGTFYVLLTVFQGNYKLYKLGADFGFLKRITIGETGSGVIAAQKRLFSSGGSVLVHAGPRMILSFDSGLNLKNTYRPPNGYSAVYLFGADAGGYTALLETTNSDGGKSLFRRMRCGFDGSYGTYSDIGSMSVGIGKGKLVTEFGDYLYIFTDKRTREYYGCAGYSLIDAAVLMRVDMKTYDSENYGLLLGGDDYYYPEPYFSLSIVKNISLLDADNIYLFTTQGTYRADLSETTQEPEPGEEIYT